MSLVGCGAETPQPTTADSPTQSGGEQTEERIFAGSWDAAGAVFTNAYSNIRLALPDGWHVDLDGGEQPGIYETDFYVVADSSYAFVKADYTSKQYLEGKLEPEEYDGDSVRAYLEYTARLAEDNAAQMAELTGKDYVAPEVLGIETREVAGEAYLVRMTSGDGTLGDFYARELESCFMAISVGYNSATRAAAETLLAAIEKAVPSV
jgi:hypothetical protein